MSFLKNLFEKRKDKKYGKGHKLGDSNTAQPSYQQQNQQGGRSSLITNDQQ